MSSQEKSSLAGTPRGVRALLWAAVASAAAHAVHGLLGLGGDGLDPVFNDWVYNGVLAAAVAACLARSVLVRAERAAWLAICAGVLSWTVGDVYWSIHLSGLETVPYPSLADACYLGLYPGLYVGIVLLLRARVPRFDRSLWLDGAVGALATGAAGAAILVPEIQDSTGGDAATVATNLAYPLGDLLLLSFAVGVVALTGWRPGRAWLFLAGGLLANGIADGAFLYAEATGSYLEGGAIDSIWLLGALLLGFAAWESPSERSEIDLGGLRMMFLPSVFALVALALLAKGAFGTLDRVSLGLATAALLLVVVRMVISFAENVRLMNEAERVSRAKTDFLANISHELRTPLTAIIGFSEMMETPVSDGEREQFVGRILTNGRHLQQLIDDLLDLSKVEAGMMEFQPERVDLRAVVDEVAGTMRVLADSRQVELRTSIAPGLGEVVTDRARLKQVLYNYLSNALKFTPPGGRVTLSLEPEGSAFFRLEVVDTGIGISPEDQPRLFTEFQQVGPARDAQGTGLGLALVKRIVEAQDGHVGMESAPGMGSVFFAVLPQRAKGARLAGKPAARELV